VFDWIVVLVRIEEHAGADDVVDADDPSYY
jgi:hypothetical protein